MATLIDSKCNINLKIIIMPSSVGSVYGINHHHLLNNHNFRTISLFRLHWEKLQGKNCIFKMFSKWLFFLNISDVVKKYSF